MNGFMPDPTDPPKVEDPGAEVRQRERTAALRALAFWADAVCATYGSDSVYGVEVPYMMRRHFYDAEFELKRRYPEVKAGG
jgi:hypothetical protein